jgi:glycosyltransferase involved in cell wall biosynthesis
MKALVLVSARADADLRRAVEEGRRPCPEYLRLERRHGVELLDWSRVPSSLAQRSVRQSMRHVRAALPGAAGADVVLSDGEHLGIPLALALATRRIGTPHVCIAHHLLARRKLQLLKATKAYRRIDRIVVHSANQVGLVREAVPAAAPRLRVVPYGVDTAFWSPQDVRQEADLVVSAGREHRDYATLVDALPSAARLSIADHSPFSPAATCTAPATWPATVARQALRPAALRDLYGRAALVVVPIVETTFPAGITTLLEAMSMGKAVVVTGTQALSSLFGSGAVAIVPPGDVQRMREVIGALLSDEARREEMGQRARRTAVEEYGLDAYVDGLVRVLDEAVGGRAVPAPSQAR